MKLSEPMLEALDRCSVHGELIRYRGGYWHGVGERKVAKGRPLYEDSLGTLTIRGLEQRGLFRQSKRMQRGDSWGVKLTPAGVDALGYLQYRGYPEDGENDIVGEVWVHAGNRRIRRLDPRYDLVNHSPTGFAWHYEGSGPAQLALAILADVAGEAIALAHYQDFKRDVIAALPEGAFGLTRAGVRTWLIAGGARV